MLPVLPVLLKGDVLNGFNELLLDSLQPYVHAIDEKEQEDEPHTENGTEPGTLAPEYGDKVVDYGGTQRY